MALSSEEAKKIRLRQLLEHLESQMNPSGDAPELLLRYLNRLDEPATSASSLRRWKLGEKYPWKSRRERLARAIGCSGVALERFLDDGLPSAQEFFASLPPISSKYRSDSPAQLVIHLADKGQVLEAIFKLLAFLSLDDLGKVFKYLQNLIQLKLNKLGLIQANFYKQHPLVQLFKDHMQRNNLSIEEFALQIADEEFGQDSEITFEGALEILSGERLPIPDELDWIAGYLRTPDGNHYDLSLLMSLLGGSASTGSSTNSDENSNKHNGERDKSGNNCI